MLKKYFVILFLCLTITSLYAGTANEGGCNSTGLTYTSPATDVATADTSCASGFCNLAIKKCKAKKASGHKCNRAAQCSTNNCVNSKCA